MQLNPRNLPSVEASHGPVIHRPSLLRFHSAVAVQVLRQSQQPQHQHYFRFRLVVAVQLLDKF
jgi:hypothetical protein